MQNIDEKIILVFNYRVTKYIVELVDRSILLVDRLS